MPKRISAADPTPVRVVIVTLDGHLAGTAGRAERKLRKELPGLTLSLHAAAEWEENPAALERCRADIAQGDIIVATMLFMEEHIRPILPWLRERRDQCDAMIGAMSAGEIVRLTRIGRFSMGGQQAGIISLLKRREGASGASTGSRK